MIPEKCFQTFTWQFFLIFTSQIAGCLLQGTKLQDPLSSTQLVSFLLHCSRCSLNSLLLECSWEQWPCRIHPYYSPCTHIGKLVAWTNNYSLGEYLSESSRKSWIPAIPDSGVMILVPTYACNLILTSEMLEGRVRTKLFHSFFMLSICAHAMWSFHF